LGNFLLISLIALFVDQISKFLVVSYLKPGESVSLLHPLLYLTHVKNAGGAFGILEHYTGLFIALSIVTIFLLFFLYLYFLTAQRKDDKILWSLPLVTGGILGNLIDRLRTGSVIDFLDLRVWPVFNFADIFIFVGTILLLLGLFSSKSYERER